MPHKENALYQHYEYSKKENCLYARWFQRNGLSHPQFIILDAILRSPEGTEPTTLADAFFMPKQTITGLLDQLERAGFVRREANKNDRRRTRVRILPAGEDFASRIIDKLDQYEQAVISAIPPEDIETFNNVYAAIIVGLEKHLLQEELPDEGASR